MRPGQIVGPIVLIVLGLLFLLNNIGLDIPVGEIIGTFWPLVLIVVGVLNMSGALMGRRNLPSGLVVFSIGVLFLLQQVWGISFRHTWPALLIVIGAVGLLKAAMGPTAMAGRYMRGGRR